MIEYEDLYKKVNSMLSERRFHHSEGVVRRALEYAEIYGEDKKKVKLCAIAHDVAKELSQEEIEKYIVKYHIELDDIEKINRNLVHAKIGAAIAKNEFGFTEEMVNSIKYHTTGKENMSMLEKIIYLADATEETRKYSDIEKYVNIIKEDIDNGIFEVSKWVLNHLLEQDKIIHLDTMKCYNYYQKLLHK